MRVLVAIALFAFMTGGALAQSCSQLRAQLASAQSGGGNSALLSRLQSQHSAYGCGSSGMFGRNAICGRLEAQMQRARGGGNARQIRRLRQRVARACSGDTRSARTRSAPAERRTRTIGNRVVEVRSTSQRGVFSIFRGAESVPSEQAHRGEVERLDLDEHKPRRSSPSSGSGSTSTGPLRIGSARTICVRLCDGFYFPINSTSHHSNFNEELAMCVGRCPGADVSLYAHKRDAPVETMRSAMTGERYVNLPTAFRYRRERVSDCSCQPQTIARTGSAGEALGYVGMADGTEDETPQTASDAATAAAGGTNWERLRAVYDETGKPLHETLASLRRRSQPATTPEAPAPNAEAAEVDVSDGGSVAVASSSVRVRAVGPQFYNPEDDDAPRRRLRLPRLMSTAVSVVPVAASAVLTDGTEESAANETDAIVDPVLDEAEPGSAQTSSLSVESPTGG